MDFVEGLPVSSSTNAILVVVDMFSKFAHFLPLRHLFTAASVAKLFLDHIFHLHGMPQLIVSDRDWIFTSQFRQLLFRMAGTSLRLWSAYHPQTDCHTERMNQCLETFLHCFTYACPSQWSCWISHVEYWYNTTTHSALGHSPFEVMYDHAPRHLGLDVESLAPVSDLKTWMANRDLMQDVWSGSIFTVLNFA
jgi:hypothetical protein